MSYEVWHWRIYNVLRRLFGLMAGFFGLVSLGWGIAAVAGWAEGFDLGRKDGILHLLVGSGAMVLEWFLSRRRAFRPDLGDPSLWLSWTGVYPSDHPLRDRPRSWWMGNPR